MVGSSFQDYSYWGLIVIIEQFPEPPEAHPLRKAFGVRHFSDEIVRAFADECLTSAMVRC